MERPEFEPYIPEESNLTELTVRALILGVVMAIVLGAANAYLGMKAGLTVAATFPAAVAAMAALRLFGGSVLEENIARTTASVGEALVAGAIFTLLVFVISGVWPTLDYVDSTLSMLSTGLPFPESVAGAGIHKAGQTGASFVFSAMGFGAVWE